jgi:predicted GNAT family acetyltransferase
MQQFADVTTWYLAALHGTPVGTLLRTSLAHVSCIQAVGTLPEYRRRGVATTLNLHAVSDAIEQGDLVILQTTQGGDAERLYSHIGFTIDYPLSWYSKPL